MSRDIHGIRPAAGARTESYESRRPGDKGVARNYDQSSSLRESGRSPRTHSPHISKNVLSDSEVASLSTSSEQRRPSAVDLPGRSLEVAAAAARQDANAAAYHLNGVGDMPTVLEGPAIFPVDTSPLVESLSKIGKILLEQVADVSALKMEETNAKKRYGHRQLEFDKASEQHEKFPNTKSYQMDAKSQAEKMHKVVHDQMTQKTTALEKLAAEVAQTLIPGLVGLMKTSGVSDEQRRLEDRCNALERQVENQRKDFESQRKDFESQRKDFESQRKDFESQRKDIERQSKDIERQSKDIELLTRSNQHLEKQARMASDEQKRQSEHNKHLEREAKSMSANLEKLSRDVKVAVGKSDDLTSSLTQLSADASQNTNTIKSMSSQVDKIVRLRPELDELKLKVSRLSQQFEQASVPEQILNNSAVADLKETMFKLANQQTARCDGLSTMIDRKAAHDRKELDSLRQGSKGFGQKFQEIERKIAAMPMGISSQLETMDAAIQQNRLDIDGMKSAQDEVDGSLADIITGMIHQHATANLTPQIQALQTKFSGLELGYSSLNTLPAQVKLLQDSQQDVMQKVFKELNDVKSAAVAPAGLSSREVVEIIRAEPGLLPDHSHCTRAIYDLNQRIVAIEKLQARMNQQIVATHDSIENLQARMNNINTGALAAYMMDQLLERFPNVHAIDSSVASCRTDITQLQLNNAQVMDNIQKLQAGNATLQTQELAAAQNKDVQKRISDLAIEVGSMSSMSKNDVENVDKWVRQCNDLAKQHINLKLEVEQRVATINDQVKDIYSTMDRYQNALDREIISRETTAPSATEQRSTPTGQKIPGSLNRPNRGAGISRMSPNRSSTREVATTSVNNKKRKLSNGHSVTSHRSTSRQRGNISSRGILQQLSTDESDNELIQPVLQSDDEDQ